jgi:radical SAM protein with 4Fe4S-binding SPASM domain
MALANSYWALVRYKLRHLGVSNTLRVAYLDISEEFWHRMMKRFPSLSRSPQSIQIECTTRCNLKCTMCEISYWTEPGGDLEIEKLRAMLDHLPRLRRVDLTGIGEALMNRGFFKALKLLKSRGLYVTLNDNFTMMTEEAAQRVVELGVDQIFLSLDGATKQTYEEIRVGANFEKVVGNARRLVEIKKQLGKNRPEVKVNTVVSASNYREIPEIIDLSHDLGIGMVQFVNVMVFENTAGLDTSAIQGELQAKFHEALTRARRRGILVKIELFDKRAVETCNFPWKRNFVSYDGYVHPCCYTTQTGDRAAQNQRSFGNLVTSSFERIWNSTSYSSFRNKMKAGTLPQACEHCPKYFGKPDCRPITGVSPNPVVSVVSNSPAA